MALTDCNWKTSNFTTVVSEDSTTSTAESRVHNYLKKRKKGDRHGAKNGKPKSEFKAAAGLPHFPCYAR